MTPPPAAAVPAGRAPGALAPGRTQPPARPRRVSGPARRRDAPRGAPAQRLRGRARTIPLARALVAVSSSRLLDRLVRGRLAIGLIAFALIGIVTLQLGLLKLNSSIGRTIEREALLQRQNSALSIENSELLAGERVEARASQLGMRLAPVGELRFLDAHGREPLAAAVSALHAPAGATQHVGEASGSSSAGETPSGSSAIASEGGESAAPSGSEEHESGEAPGAGASGEATSSGASGEAASSGASGEAAAPATAESGSYPAEATGGGTQASGG